MKLEKYLILNKYLLSLFGVHSISDLREELKNKKECFDNDGRSFFLDTLLIYGQGSNLLMGWNLHKAKQKEKGYI